MWGWLSFNSVPEMLIGASDRQVLWDDHELTVKGPLKETLPSWDLFLSLSFLCNCVVYF